MAEPLDALPGFRRRIIIAPAANQVSAAVEDDFHCMAVTIHHDGGIATSIEPVMEREPWTTCPGAIEQLKRTFTNVPLAGFAERGEKSLNCTHLHDMAVLGAAHAHDEAPLVYDILVSDPVDGVMHAGLRRNGACVMRWVFRDGTIIEPAELSGLTLHSLGPWIATLDPVPKEQARVFRWATMVGHGRLIPMAEQSDATQYPPNCHTFQPANAARAKRVGKVKDFTIGTAQPLERFPRQARDPGDNTLSFANNAA